MIYTSSFIVTKVPEKTCKDDNIFISGDFCGWIPNMEKNKLRKLENGKYMIEIQTDMKQFEYKFTRGEWYKAECEADGGKKKNRKFDFDKSAVVFTEIEGWEDLYHSVSEYVTCLDENFIVPQLNENVRIWLFLPPLYFEKRRRYPVVYMFEGQNLFDQYYADDTEWGIDKSLAALQYINFKIPIVVGIEAISQNKSYEFSPGFSSNEKNRGNLLSEFIIFTLKPFIDKHLRTLKGSKSTFIAGNGYAASLALVTALKFNKVFGGAGVFLPKIEKIENYNNLIENVKTNKDQKIAFLSNSGSTNDIEKIRIIIQQLKNNEFTPQNIIHEIQVMEEREGSFLGRYFITLWKWLSRQ